MDELIVDNEWTLRSIQSYCRDIGTSEICDGTPFDEFTIIEAIKREVLGRKNGVFFVTPRRKELSSGFDRFRKQNHR